MKKLLIALPLCCAMFIALNAGAAEEKKAEKKGEKQPLTEEQKAVMKEILGKYDKNGNKRLDPEEREAISKEDREKMAKAGLGGAPKKKKAE